jgi:hypothetical protein
VVADEWVALRDGLPGRLDAIACGMPRSQPAPAAAPAPADAADAAEILRAITRIGYLITRARRHDTVRTVAAVPLDRAAVMVLQQLRRCRETMNSA